jgi:serine protease Do
MKQMKKQSRTLPTWLVLAGVAWMAGVVLAHGQTPGANPAAQYNGRISALSEGAWQQCCTGNGESLAPIVKKVAPAVVKIVTAVSIGSFADALGVGGERFLSAQSFGETPRAHLRLPLLRGLGSGVIVSNNGYILTSSHIVQGATEVKVTLHDGRVFMARTIGSDPMTDVAVVKVEADSLPTVPLAESRKVEVGDMVLAIGNPFGVGQTVTHGIVSATDRGGLGIDDYESFIQTDAPINPGNSGGALVDVHGCLIGINTAILSGTGGHQGIGFAIPSDLARRAMTDLVKYGRVVRGYLGVEAQDLTPELANEFHVKPAAGALLGSVFADGPADKAGLKVGDIVTRFNGQEVRESRQLKLAVAELKPGDAVSIEVLRNGSAKELRATVGPPSDHRGHTDAEPLFDQQDLGSFDGVALADLDGLVRTTLRIPSNVLGVVVLQVEPRSAAAEAGLRPGDVIQSIRHHHIKSAKEAERWTRCCGKSPMLLRVWNGGSSRFLVVARD